MRPRMRIWIAALAVGGLFFPIGSPRAAELLLQGDLEDGDDPAYAISAPTGIAASPDGRSVYVAGFGEDAIDVFARNPASGALEHRFAVRNGEGRIDALGGVLTAVVSGDGRNLYAVGLVDQSIMVFNRDIETGRLFYVWKKKNGLGGVTGLDNPRSIVESADGRHVYLACEATLLVFTRSDVGWITLAQKIDLPPLSGTQGIAMDPEGRNLYLGSYEDGKLLVYRRNPVWGGLTLLETQQNGVSGVEGLAGIDAIAVSADGASVYANGTLDSSVVHFARDPATGLLSFVARHRDGVGGVDGLEFSGGLSIGANGDSRLFAGGADAAVGVFGRDPSTGALDFASSVPLPGSGFIGSGAQVLAVGGHLYVANSIDDRISIFGIAPLQLVETEEDGVAGAEGLLGAEGVAVDPYGRNLYATGVTDDALTTFSIDRASGALTATSVLKNGVGGVTGLRGALGVVVSPDARHVYVIGAGNSTIAAFARDGESGALSFIESEQAGNQGVQDFLGPRIAAISPDGRQIYTAAFQSDAVTWFTRDTESGALSFGGSAKNGVGGIEGVGGAYGVSISPDGRHVYAAGLNDDSIAVLSRDAATGALAFASRVQDGVAGVDGLDGATSTAVSADGRHVYATGFNDNAVAVFERDAETGALTFIERKRDNEAGIPRLSGPYYVAVSDDGRSVIVTASAENAINVFRRDPVTGRLFLTQIEQDGVDGITKAASPRGIAIAPGGLATYIASSGGNAVHAFAPEPDVALLGAVSLAALAAIRARR